MAKCPKPTQDIELNLKNRQKAIDKIGYGPLNPNEPNEDFWQKKADMWDVSIDEAKKQKCGNCAGFNRSDEMLDCISKGMGDENDSWDAIEAGQLGYCEPLDFKCAASRTCDAWIDRAAKSSGAKVGKVDIYLKTVDALLGTIDKKADRITEGSFVEWNASGGKARGRVEHVMKKGTLGVPDSKFSINAEPDDPAVLIRIWRKNGAGQWDETDVLVGHKMSTISRIEPLSGKDAGVDLEHKADRKVRDASYWGRPVGTPITPGMKPTGPTSPAGRARSMSAGSTAKPSTSKPSTNAARPKRRVAVPKPGGSSEGKPRRKPTVSRDGQIAVDKYNAEQEGLKSPKAQAAGRLIDDIIDKVNSEWRDDTPGKVSMNIGIAKDLDRFDVDGISDEERSVLAEKFGKIDRSKIMDKWQFRLEDVAEKLGAEGLSEEELEKIADRENDREADIDNAYEMSELDAISESESPKKPKKKPLPKVRRPKGRSERVAKISVSDIADKANTPDTSVRKAEDFSVKNSAKELKKISKTGRPDATGSEADPIDVGDDIELAHKLLSEGKHIRMKDEMAVSTLLDKLHENVKDAREKGADAPEYDLCKVSVAKTNLFCVESKGIPRVKMPQFKGTPVEGSFADTRKNSKGEGDVEPEFRELLKELGIGTEMKTVKANELRASQDNLDGPKVVGMAQAMREGKIPDAPIFVTKDGYILDGHHRWAAKVAIDLDDGVSGDIEMPVEVIDAEIGYLIDLANGFTEMAGIKAKGLGAAADAADAKPTTGRSGDKVRLEGVGTVTQSENTQGKKSAETDCEPCKGHVY